MHRPRNPHLMLALWFLGIVKMNREGTRRMRETMEKMELPAPEFSQKEIGFSLVRVILRNNIKVRRVWIDQDVGRLVGEALAADLTEREKRILNWVAEYKEIRVNDVVKLIGTSWQSANKILVNLASQRILQWIRFVPREKGKRDPEAYFRLRSADPLPDGASEQKVERSTKKRNRGE